MHRGHQREQQDGVDCEGVFHGCRFSPKDERIQRWFSLSWVVSGFFATNPCARSENRRVANQGCGANETGAMSAALVDEQFVRDVLLA